MTVSHAIVTCILHFPKWFSGAFLLSVFVAFVALGAVAISTDREVHFFPPSVGKRPPDQYAVALVNLRTELGATADKHLQVIEHLQERLDEMRKLEAETSDFQTRINASLSITKYELEIDAERHGYSRDLNNIVEALDRLNAQCHH